MVLNEEILQSLLANSSLGVIVCDINLKIKIWNKAVEKILHTNRGEVLGEKILDIYPFVKHQNFQNNLQKAIKGQSTSFQIILKSSPVRSKTRKIK